MTAAEVGGAGAAGGPLRLGTRRSPLARAQSEMVAERLRATSGRAVVLVEVTTQGDVDRAPLRQIGGTGVFVAALREALLEGRVDLAVHSFKDLPTAPAPGLVLAAVPPREDPRDVLVGAGGAGLGDLPVGARVGTGSPRRAAQLRALGLGLDVVDVRGNVDTRVGFVTSGRLDAVVLASAGLRRLGRHDEVTEVLDVDQVLPAPAQGALALECRADDEATAQACAALDDPAARAATTAERALLAALEAGCSAPVGALARPAAGEAGGLLELVAVVAATDGSRVLRRSVRGDEAEAAELGRRLAAELLADGAAGLVADGAPAGSAAAGAGGGSLGGLPAGGALDVAPGAVTDPHHGGAAAAPPVEPPPTRPPVDTPVAPVLPDEAGTPPLPIHPSSPALRPAGTPPPGSQPPPGGTSSTRRTPGTAQTPPADARGSSSQESEA